MTLDELFDDFVRGFPERKFSAGLLIAFIDFFSQLDLTGVGAKNLDDLLVRFPRQTITAAGKRANTLIVALPSGRTSSLRKFYNAAERFFRVEHKRYDYPSCAPHATQAWADYRPWLDSLVTYSSGELATLRQRVADYVLDTLKSQAFDPASVATEPPLFRLLLEGFELIGQRGEPTGAAFQGMVFGFLRADNPHLQVEIDKVRTGSKRLQRVGDIDGWEGARLAMSAEVKQFILRTDDVSKLEPFAHEVTRRGALGLVAALGFEEGTRDLIEGLGIRAVSTDDLLSIVQLWDPLKQRTAVTSLVYYARHVEKNSVLADRIDAFLNSLAESDNAAPPTS
ncbi:MAG: hypothetical protein U1E42_03155 [Rhodospirillales bacterium]